MRFAAGFDPFYPMLFGGSLGPTSNQVTHSLSISDYTKSASFLESSPYTKVSTTPTNIVQDNFGFGWMFGPSFTLDAEPGEKIISATLTFSVESVTGGTGTLEVNLQKSLASSEPWTGGSGSSNPPNASTLLSESVTGISSTVGTKTVDVTAMIQALVNDTNWAKGDWTNWLISASSGGSLNLTVGSVGSSSSTNPPTLEVVTGTQMVKFAAQSLLHRTAAFTGDPTSWDFATVSAWLYPHSTMTHGQTFVSGDTSLGQNSFNFSIDPTTGKAYVSKIRDDISQVLVSQKGHVPFSVNLGLSHYLWELDRLANTIKGYRNGSLVVTDAWDSTATAPGAAVTPHISGHDVSGEPSTVGDLLDAVAIGSLWMHKSAGADTTGKPGVDKFIVNGRPKDLGSDGSKPTGGTKPLLYMDGNATAWSSKVNLGAGGNFDLLIGSISDA